MKAIKAVLVLIGLLSLSACTSMNGQFDCPLQDVGSCRSMRDTDRLVSAGGMRADSSPKLKGVKVYQHNFLDDVGPHRIPETTMKIWFAPYEDSNGNYHDMSSVYTIIHQSHWKGKPPKSVYRDGVE